MIFVEDRDFQAVEFQEKLGDQGGGLQRVAGTFALEECRRDALEPEECQAIEGVTGSAVALLSLGQQECEGGRHPVRL